jgi:hypothetical protein
MAGAPVPDRPDSHNASPWLKVHGSRRSAHREEEGGPGASPKGETRGSRECPNRYFAKSIIGVVGTRGRVVEMAGSASASYDVMRRIGELIDAQRELHKQSGKSYSSRRALTSLRYVSL